MDHEELCGYYFGKACNCGVVEDSLAQVEQQIEEALAVMNVALDPCAQELYDALRAIHKTKE